jgi:small-conductance mechanosensitive channel
MGAALVWGELGAGDGGGRGMLVDFFSTSSIDGWDIFLALVVLVAGWIAGSFAKRGMLRLLARVWPSVTSGTAMTVARIARYAILLITIGIVLTILGAPLQPVLAAALLVSAVAFLALRGLAANLGAGLVIQARHVVRVGDEIEIIGFRGVVTEINGRSVIVHTDDGRSVRLPNSDILENPLTNLTERQLYRSELEVRVGGGRPYGEVAEIIAGGVAASERVRAVPAVQVLVARYSPVSTTFRVRFWHDPHHRAEVRSSAMRSLIDALDKENIAAALDWKIPDAPLTIPGPL